MSIFGPPSDSVTSSAADAATTDYVDQQDALRVLKAGNTMTRNLVVDPGTGPSDTTVSGLGVAISEGNLAIGVTGGGPEIDLLQSADIPGRGVRHRNGTNNENVSYGWNASGRYEVRHTQLGAPQVLVVNEIRSDGAGNGYLTALNDPVQQTDAVTKNYVDGRMDRVFMIARIRTGTQDHQTGNLDTTNHVAISTIFLHAYGVSAASWNPTTPAAGVYSVTASLRFQAPAGTGSLANVYTSINGSVSYAIDTNIVYRVYGRTNNMSSWHSFQLSGLVTLSQGDTLGLTCSYGTGVWTFHTTASMQIARVSI